MPMFTKLGHKTSTAAKSGGQSAAKANAASGKDRCSGSANKHVLDNNRWQVGNFIVLILLLFSIKKYFFIY